MPHGAAKKKKKKRTELVELVGLEMVSEAEKSWALTSKSYS